MYRIPPNELNWDPIAINADPINGLVESQQDIEILHVGHNPVTHPELTQWCQDTSASSPSPSELSSANFLDKETVNDYECCICYNLVKNPVLCDQCAAILCRSPCYYALREAHRTTKLSCPVCKVDPFVVSRLHKTDGRKSWKIFDQLLVTCYWAPDCKDIVQSRYYKHHIEHCKYNPEYCVLCEMLITNPVHKRENCLIKLEDLKRRKRAETSNELSSLRKELDDLRNQIKSIENKAIVSCHSNNIKSVTDHNDPRTKFEVKFGDRKIRIYDISLNATGADLRREVEAKFGCRVGPIIRFDHTVIKDEKLLKQHQLCYKKTQLVAFPTNRPVEDGRTLNIDVTGRQEELV